MEDVSRWQLISVVTMPVLTGINVLRGGVTAWLWAALVAVVSVGAVLAWRVRLRSMVPVPSVEGLYASAAVLAVVTLGFGAVVVFQIARPNLFRIVAHGVVLCWAVVLVTERRTRHASRHTESRT